MISRRKGFTLIELLVVIAIIAILAAMLFPVFARARESARKIQCLANVKNIATAFQMYLTDYDRLPPAEHRQEVADFFNNIKDGCNNITGSNPYLRWPVILDEYIKNRDVWRCPSAKMSDGARWIVPGSDWFTYVKNNESVWMENGPCYKSFPPGWGGSVTDSIRQATITTPGENGAFEMGIGLVQETDMKTSSVSDPSYFVLCADLGSQMDFWNTWQLAFPDLCRIETTWGGSGITVCGAEGDTGCCDVDWSNCSESQICGIPFSQRAQFWNDPAMQKRYSRHMGGSNIGFMDGHAAWWAQQAILSNQPSVNTRSCSCGCDKWDSKTILQPFGGWCQP